ncbi:putative phage-like protein [Buchnera aphidicola (Cinara tujafilina)]|uniref:Putative phage-like protein n=1 Tax=Buchnera aphidicola (Cinara tujafilina) TaxID=261317 RepID=F7WZ05_9GAMM|nr:endonuclease SmrB [Buchnera aphidicola]AEH39655.1 putative phage-like protein [Buchnera aphidicola (Cinara tujafilina)]
MYLLYLINNYYGKFSNEKKNKISFKEKEFFLYHMRGVKKIKQDRVYHRPIYGKKKLQWYTRHIIEQDGHSFYFKNLTFEKPFFIREDPIFFIRKLNCNIDIKKLKNGEYIPEIILDLHGVNLYEAEKELGKLITICHQENIICASIIHGYGKRILKNQIPFWLIQHPDVIAFHQAPKTFGYDAAIFIFLQKK